ncbi:MAG: hypothetical protein M3P33_02700 [bacterium]|nr:hypothetical protein [bacterium]
MAKDKLTRIDPTSDSANITKLDNSRQNEYVGIRRNLSERKTKSGLLAVAEEKVVKTISEIFQEQNNMTPENAETNAKATVSVIKSHQPKRRIR